ncbi:MAG: monovalent cation/H+ antiporter subunit A [Gammaproteobacteria bacterium]|nr:monovalent cation/H+ antiporter subunit A [Gammaproteobacteria bacterium]MDH5272645.1 monovalent cation/H+ antiporter subunit A [Gammaproteobacteria bacterium]
MLLSLVILIPLLGAWLPAALSRALGVDPARTAAALAAASLALVLSQAPSVLAGATLVSGWSWIPEAGLNATFRLDGFGLLFALLILGIGLLVILYSRYYLSPEEPKERFYGLLLLFMGAMLGVVLAENLLLLVTFWELTSLSSFLLIGFWRHDADARRGARLALMVTGAGGLALLAGVLLIGHVVGSFELSDVLASGPVIKAHPLYETMLVLVLLGAFTKSAQFPFHFWLPHAMAAPTPVSAYLHSATMVKAGIFLLGRLFPAFAGTETWFYIVSGVGLTTQLFAAYVALFRHDLKGLLAYSTVSHLGLITLLFGFGTPAGAVAAVFHIINHAVFKASLFMAAGIVDHETGTRDMRRLSGLARFMPWTAALATVAAGAMAGVPLLNGFLSKEMFFAETLQVQWLGSRYWVLPVAATLASVFTVAYSTRFVHDVFFGPPPQGLARVPHAPPRWMKVPVEILVGLCLLVGLLPGLIVDPLLGAAGGAVLQAPLPEYSLALWHGFDLPVLMSVVALVGGASIYFARRYYFGLHGYRQQGYDGRALVEGLVALAVAGSRRLVDRIANASLQRYVLLLLLATLGVGFVGARGLSLAPIDATPPPDALAVALTAALVFAAVAATALHARRLLALVLIGVVGLVVSLAFVRFSAPDLALTQLLVEIVTVLLLLLALYFMPAESPRESSGLRRARDAVVAIAAGLGAGLLAWAVLTRPFSTIAWYYLENAKPQGGGYNVVNVILVDFRGFDTLGEITVLGIAAVAIVALLQELKLDAPQRDWDGRPWATERHPLMLRVLARPLLPLALLVSVYLFLRGHNAPGGGFIAGLVTGTAILLQYVAYGSDWARERLPWNYSTAIALGLLLATATGLASWAFGAPFLTSTFGYVHWPVVGEFELASAMMFDLGIYVVVVGVVMVIVGRLGALSGPAARGS